MKYKIFCFLSKCRQNFNCFSIFSGFFLFIFFIFINYQTVCASNVYWSQKIMCNWKVTIKVYECTFSDSCRRPNTPAIVNYIICRIHSCSGKSVFDSIRQNKIHASVPSCWRKNRYSLMMKKITFMHFDGRNIISTNQWQTI
jgi:hypothetical protein